MSLDAPAAERAATEVAVGSEEQVASRSGARSAEIMARGRAHFPGGVNSPVRAFGGVGGEPFVAARGEGARVWDADGNEYIDYILSWGPLVLGHAPPVVLDALAETMKNGTSFGMPTGLEVQLAEKIAERMPHLEMMRFTSSGTEAAMTVVRLARAVTGRDHILKFEGCYHGHADGFLVRAGSGVATLGLPDSDPLGRGAGARCRSPRSCSNRSLATVDSSNPRRSSFPVCVALLTKQAPCSSLMKS